MAFFTTTVTGLYRLVNRSLGLRAIAGDMAKAATIVAFDTIGLAVFGIVIETTALVTDHTTASTITATISTTISTATGTTTISTSTTGTITSQMTKTVAIIAATTRTAVYANIGAIGLKVTNATTRITLFGIGSSRLRALIGLVTRLLAIITKPFRFGAGVSKMTDIAALETAFFSERHFFRQTKKCLYRKFFEIGEYRGK